MTLSELAELRHEQMRWPGPAVSKLTPESFVFSFEPGGGIPPHPDNISHVFAKVRTRPRSRRTSTCTRCGTSMPPRSTR